MYVVFVSQTGNGIISKQKISFLVKFGKKPSGVESQLKNVIRLIILIYCF